MKTVIASLALALSFAFSTAACSHSAEQPTSTQARAASAADRVIGTWRFVFDASDVASKVASKCDAEHTGDKSASDACVDAIREQGGKELIAFVRDASGAAKYRSFQIDGGVETLFMEAPIELTEGGKNQAIAKVTGGARGEGGKDLGMPKVLTMPIELIDDQTIAMMDPHKGKLVFTRQ